VLRTLVAFANTAGGTLVIGIEDGTRAVRGVDDPLAVEEKLANVLADDISPRLVPEIDIVPWRSTQVLVVQVHLSPSRPHYLASAGAYVRIGSSNRRADPPLIAGMARLASFDETPLPELAAEEVDVASASNALGRAVSTRHLVSPGALIEHQGRPVPTVGGILLFGLDRTATLPDAWLQLGAFAGADRSRIPDQRDVDEPLTAWVDAGVTFVERHSS
jgi:predicted HTH transcriptional regulator